LTLDVVWKTVQQFGSTALLCWLLWKLADKWLGEFLKASKEQTVAMVTQAAAVTQLAATVQAGQTDQHEVLLAVRVQSRSIRDMKEMLEKLVEGQNGANAR
jgi:hypothetical protein